MKQARPQTIINCSTTTTTTTTSFFLSFFQSVPCATSTIRRSWYPSVWRTRARGWCACAAASTVSPAGWATPPATAPNTPGTLAVTRTRTARKTHPTSSSMLAKPSDPPYVYSRYRLIDYVCLYHQNTVSKKSLTFHRV